MGGDGDGGPGEPELADGAEDGGDADDADGGFGGDAPGGGVFLVRFYEASGEGLGDDGEHDPDADSEEGKAGVGL